MKLEPPIRAFLQEPRYAVLATLNPSGAPHLTEMWYDLRADEIVFNTTEERTKKRNLERDPRASILVSGRNGDPVWASVSYVRADGVARRIATGNEALEDIVALSIRTTGRGRRRAHAGPSPPCAGSRTRSRSSGSTRKGSDERGRDGLQRRMPKYL